MIGTQSPITIYESLTIAMHNHLITYIVGSCCLISLVFILSCSDDEPITQPEAKLEFSTDTLTFDTVFTAIGSATRLFKVYNRHQQPIVISQIRLDGGSLSNFRLNIDGNPTLETTNLEVPAEDSIYIFAEVKSINILPNSAILNCRIRK